MRKSFRDKVQDALAKRHIRSVTARGKPCRSAEVNIITTEVAFRHFHGKDFRKEIIWSDESAWWYTGIIHVGDMKFVCTGGTKDVVVAHLAECFVNNVPLFTAGGKTINPWAEKEHIWISGQR